MADLRRIENFGAIFPVRQRVLHGSGVVTADGRVLYVYVPNVATDGANGGGAVRGVYFPNAVELAHKVRVVSNTTKPYRVGVPIEGTDHCIIDAERGNKSACSVWRTGNTLYLAAMYPDAEAVSGPGVLMRTELWVSPSGNGGDWVRSGDIQPPRLYEGGYGYMRSSRQMTLGVGTPVAGGFLLPITKWMADGLGTALGWTRPSVKLGNGSSWSDVDEHRYYIGGSYGYGNTRRVVPHNGEYFWNSWGNVERDKSGYSADGTSWTEFNTLPLSNDSESPYLISEGGWLYRMRGYAIWRTTDPRVGWEQATDRLNMGALTLNNTEVYGAAGGYLWQEISPQVWALFSHDKVWFVFGGWLLGAIGRS